MQGGAFWGAGRSLGDVAAHRGGGREQQTAAAGACAQFPSLCQAQSLRATANQEGRSVMMDAEKRRKGVRTATESAGTAGGRASWEAWTAGEGMEEGRERARSSLGAADDVPNHPLIQIPRGPLTNTTAHSSHSTRETVRYHPRKIHREVHRTRRYPHKTPLAPGVQSHPCTASPSAATT